MNKGRVMVGMLVLALSLGALASAVALTLSDEPHRGVANTFAPESSLVTPAILYGLLVLGGVAAATFLAVNRRRRHSKPGEDIHDEPLTSVADRESSNGSRGPHSHN